MTKWIIVLLLFLLQFSVTAQHTSFDSTNLETVSQELLKREITFSFEGGRLENVLSQLAEQTGINLSYSNDRISDVTTNSFQQTALPLFSLLDLLLENTDFTYLTIGRNILILKKAPADSVDSLSNNTTSLTSSKNNAHIYSPRTFNDTGISPLQRKIIKELYREELKWAAKRHQDSATERDSLSVVSPPLPTDINLSEFYVSAAFGLPILLPKISNATTLPWQQEFLYDNKMNSRLNLAITGGVLHKNILMGTGISFQRLHQEDTWQEIKKKGPPVETPSGAESNHDTISTSVSQRYQVVSIPLEIGVFKRQNEILASASAGLQLHFIQTIDKESNKLNDVLKEYYSDNAPDKFSSTINSFLLSSFLNVKIGYYLKENMMLATELRYNRFLIPLRKNSLFKLYPNALLWSCSFTYFLDSKK